MVDRDKLKALTGHDGTGEENAMDEKVMKAIQAKDRAEYTKTDQEKMQDFVNEYNALCQKHGYQVAAAPIFVATNHGTWEQGIQMSINKFEPPVR